MTEKTRLQLLAWAREYHCAAFIQGDPVQFPHRYTQKQDIEVSGLLTAIMSFGNRRQILKKADGLHGLMGASPYRYVLSCRWKEDFLPTDRSSFYRMLSHADFYTYFVGLSGYTDGEAVRISGSFSQEPSKETEYVSAVDDTERVGSGFRHLEELRPSRFADSFGYARLQGGLSFGAYRYGNILSEECAEHNRGFGGSLSGRPLFGRFRIVRQRGKRSAVRLGFGLTSLSPQCLCSVNNRWPC